MRRLKIQFLLFFIFLASAVSLLLWHSSQQMNREEQALWSSMAEKVYNHFQSQISLFLTLEDRRSFHQYRFFYLPKGMMPIRGMRNRSPLSYLPKDDPRGLVGYFQIDPNSTFSTPYLPRAHHQAFVDHKHRRRELYQKLNHLTQSLRTRLTDGAHMPITQQTAISGYIELGLIRPNPAPNESREPEIDGGLENDDNSIYPDPLKERKNKMRLYPQGKAAAKAHQPDKPFNRFWRRRMVPASPHQVELFADQEDSITTQSLSATHQRAERQQQRHARALEQRYGANAPAIYVDPFQARLVADDHLIFYRKVWLDQKLYIQGFVVELEKFYSWLMDRSFANSDLPNFSTASLTLGDELLLRYGRETNNTDEPMLLFDRTLGYPLDSFQWKIHAAGLPHLSTRLYWHIFASLLCFLLTFGLYLIYRTAASQVTLSQKRQDFVSAVTHELKTPLTSIRMYSEMLSDNWVNDESKKSEYYEQINKESGRLSRLIDNVLQLARLEKGAYPLNLKQADPSHDFVAIAKELQNLAFNQGFHLDYTMEDSIPAIEYDEDAVKQILLILLDNSIKFSSTSEPKLFLLKLCKINNHVIWSWRDHGPGIPEREKNKVFQQFYRSENEMTRTTKGTGIGLAMAKMISGAMNADISLHNHAGDGLEVKLRFKCIDKT